MTVQKLNVGDRINGRWVVMEAEAIWWSDKGKKRRMIQYRLFDKHSRCELLLYGNNELSSFFGANRDN